MPYRRILLLIVVVGLGLGTCAAIYARPAHSGRAAQKADFRRLPSPTPTPTLTSTPRPTLTPAPAYTFAPRPTPTAHPLAPYFVESLRARPYAAGAITVVAPLERNAAFTKYLITYPSDGLEITGLMNLPAGDGPFPVIILNHGYYDPAVYVSGMDTQLYAEIFAQHGYLTLAPDYRLYGGSQPGPDPYRTGFAVDLVNLIYAVPSLPQARAGAIGLWGHSMGGGVALEALVLNPPGVRAAVLNAPMSGDFADNYHRIVATRDNAPLGPDWAVAPEDDPAAYQQLSPINYLSYVDVPVQIHQGLADNVVPPEWATRLAAALAAAGKDATLYTYPGAAHAFYGSAGNLCLARTLQFFDARLKTP